MIRIAWLSITIGLASASAQTPSDLRSWGADVLGRIESEMKLPDGLYADQIEPGKPPDRPSFMWACGVQLSALAAAARADRMYVPALKSYVKALDRYWQAAEPAGGYDVLPVPKPLDRYYDDNEWMAIALIEAYEVTHDRGCLDRAEKALRFALTGEDEKIGGGIYWREEHKGSKNTCSNAPAIVAAIRLYRTTHKREYLDAAKRTYEWTNAHLQDADGLYFDNIDLQSRIERTKWSYNSALMIRANLLMRDNTGESRYVEEARRIATAAEKRWIQPETGAIGDDSAFAHLLCEAFLYLSEASGDSHWRDVSLRALYYLHDRGRDPNGHYGSRWDKSAETPLSKVRLIDQAAAARAFFRAAR